MINPLPGVNIGACRMNKTKHGNSVNRRESVPGHNTVCWKFGAPANADAGDWFCPAGTPVVAAHDGKITRRVKSLGCVYIENPWAVTVYAHVDLLPKWKVGSEIKIGEVIGHVSGTLVKDPHLHFEVFCLVNGKMKVITGRNPEAWRRAITKRIGN